jgi:hypothetical protein
VTDSARTHTRKEKFLKLQHKFFIFLCSSVHTNTRYYEPGVSLQRLKATTNIYQPTQPYGTLHTFTNIS